MKLKIFPENKHLYAISDIHGGYVAFSQLITYIKPGSPLFILGDIIEKGEDSLNTLRLVQKMCEEKRAFAIMGNNDYAFLKSLEVDNLASFIRRLHNKKSIVYQMVSKSNLDGEPLEIQKKVKEVYKKEISFLSSLDTEIELEDFVFVHAGLDSGDLQTSSFRGKLQMPQFYNVGHHMDKIVVCGHYPVAMYYYDRYDNNILIDEKKKIICIDGGYKATNLGQLNMLEIVKEDCGYKYYTYDADEYETILATDDQEHDGSLRGVCWPDLDLELIKHDEYFSIVKVKKTKEIFRAKNEYIYETETGLKARDDIPHNFLGFKKGDHLKAINITPGGYCLGKINGECGWVQKSKITRCER